MFKIKIVTNLIKIVTINFFLAIVLVCFFYVFLSFLNYFLKKKYPKYFKFSEKSKIYLYYPNYSLIARTKSCRSIEGG